MRVLLVSNHGADRTYGGAERYIDDLARQLRARGHETRLMSAFAVRDPSAQSTVRLHPDDWRESRRRRLRNHLDDWRSQPWERMAALLGELAPDLMHTNNLPGISTGIWQSARSLGVPVVHTLHDYHLICPRTTLIRPDGAPCRPSPLVCGVRARRMARWSPAVRTAIGVSSHVLARHAAFFGPDTARRVILPPLVPPAGAPAEPQPRRAGLPRTLGYAGALTRPKGVGLLLDAAAELTARGYELRIAGDGPLRPEVESAPQVRYEGRLNAGELAAFMRGCDVGLIPSLWEEPGITYVLPEWLAAGRPVLATPRGGLAEADGLGGVGHFAPTASGLVSALDALRYRDAWSRLAAGLPRTTDTRDLERWTDEHLDVYAQAVSS